MTARQTRSAYDCPGNLRPTGRRVTRDVVMSGHVPYANGNGRRRRQLPNPWSWCAYCQQAVVEIVRPGELTPTYAAALIIEEEFW